MGRQVRRVALDFTWPMNTRYSGFVRPSELEPTQCAKCDGSGSSPEAAEMHARWYGHVPFSPGRTGSEPFTRDTPGVLDYARRKIQDERAFYDQYLGATGEETVRREADRMCRLWNAGWRHHLGQDDVDAIMADDRVLHGLTHAYDEDKRTWERIDRDPPTPREVNIWGLGLRGGMPNIPEYCVQKAEAARRGVPMKCADCDGHGSTFASKEAEAAYDAWSPTEPPEGEGWQLWETVSEGSPVSPVCATAEDLARYMANADARRGDLARGEGMGYEGWLKFITSIGWSPSAIGFGGTVMPGHVALATEAMV